MSSKELELILTAKDKVSGTLDKVEGRVSSIGKKIGSSLKSFAAIGVTSVVAVGVAALKFASDFDNAFNVIRSGTGATGEDFEKLKGSFKTVLSSVPQGMEEVAGAIANVNTELGLNGPALETSTKAALDMARVFDEDVNTVVNTASDVLGIFGESADEFPNLLDKIAVASERTNLPVSTLTGQLETFGPVLKNAGFNMDESIAIFGNLSAAGIDLTRVMPGINGAIRKLADEGVTDIKGALEGYIEEIGNAETSSEKLQIATEKFGAEGAQRIVTAIDAGVFSLGDFQTALDGSTGEVARLGKENLTLGERFSILKNKVLTAVEPILTKLLDFVKLLMDVAIPAAIAFIGSINLEPLITAFDSFVKIVEERVVPVLIDLGQQVADKLTPVQNFIDNLIQFAGKEAALGALAAIVAVLAISVGALAVSMIASAAPIIAVVAAATLLGAGIAILIRDWDKITERWPILNEILDDIKVSFQNFVSFIKDPVIPILQVIADKGTEVFEEILWPIIQRILLQIQGQIELVFGIIEGAIDIVVGLLTGDWDRAWDGAKKIIQALWDYIKITYENLKEIFLILLPVALEGARLAFQAASDGVIAILSAIPGLALAAIGNTTEVLKEKGKQLLKGMEDGAVEIWKLFVAWLKGLPNQMKNAFLGTSEVLYDIGRNILQGLWDGMKSIWGNIKGWIEDKANVIGDIWSSVNILSSPSKKFRYIGQMIFEGLLLGLKDKESSLMGYMTDVATRVGDETKKTVEKVQLKYAMGLYGLADSQVGVNARLAAEKQAAINAGKHDAVVTNIRPTREGMYTTSIGGVSSNNPTPIVTQVTVGGVVSIDGLTSQQDSITAKTTIPGVANTNSKTITRVGGVAAS